MQMSLAVQRHVEEKEQERRLNMPSGGLIIPCWHRRCRVRGRGFKKNASHQLVKKAAKWWEFSGKDFIGLCSHPVEVAPILMWSCGCSFNSFGISPAFSKSMDCTTAEFPSSKMGILWSEKYIAEDMEKGSKAHLKGEHELEKWNIPAINESVLEDGTEVVVVGCGESIPELVVKVTPPSSAPSLAASSGSPVPVVGNSSFSPFWVGHRHRSLLCVWSLMPAGSLNLLPMSLGLIFLSPSAALETCCFPAVCSPLQSSC